MFQTRLNQEFASGTSLYLQGQVEKLQKAKQVLQVFCSASGTLINWHKTFGFQVSSSPIPDQSPVDGFQWIPQGIVVGYLGCQIGLNLAPEVHITPLFKSIRRKLIYWSNRKLSLAGRVVICNQVLLATMWYISSSWLFSRSLLGQMCGIFLWSEKYDSPS